MKAQGAIVVFMLLESTLACAAHFKVVRQIYFYVVDKVMSGKLSCMWTGLVNNWS